MKQKRTAIDLFSGCGGLSLGLKLAGFDVLAAVENDPLAVETYKANHSEVMVCADDIRNVRAASLRKRLKLEVGELDLLAGCPPCQGFSALRTRNGARQKRDKRNRLITNVLRFARAFRPKAIMMENVPGLWPKYTDRYNKVAKFVDAFFNHFDDFRKPPRRPNSREVNFVATLEGWTRFPAAQAWIDGQDRRRRRNRISIAFSRLVGRIKGFKRIHSAKRSSALL